MLVSADIWMKESNSLIRQLAKVGSQSVFFFKLSARNIILCNQKCVFFFIIVRNMGNFALVES